MVLSATYTEQDLLQRVQGGDRAAAKLLYTNHIRYLTAVCSRYITQDEDVRDVLQESFLKIFASIGSFRYRGEGSLRAWMTRIVVNESLRWLRSRQIEWVEMGPETAEVAEEEPDISHIPNDVIHSMIRCLPDGYRMVFNLYVLEGKSHREIADLLHITEGTSASQLHRAKALLAKQIEQYRLQHDL